MYNNVYFDTELQEQIPKGGGIKRYAKMSVIASWWDLDDEPICTEYYELDDHIMAFDASEKIIGYNIMYFDWKVLEKYITSSQIKRYKKKSFDIYVYMMQKTYFHNGKQKHLKPSLNDISVPTLESPKINLGMTAPMAWQKGYVEELMEYCKHDVRLTKGVWEFGHEQGYVKLKDHEGKLREVNVNW